MSEKPKAVIIGAGVGGLASAASLAQTQKYDVTVYERMSFAGGRFTQHDHDGFQIPTGAVHMIPVSYTHLTLRRYAVCRSRWSPYH